MKKIAKSFNVTRQIQISAKIPCLARLIFCHVEHGSFFIPVSAILRHDVKDRVILLKPYP